MASVHGADLQAHFFASAIVFRTVNAFGGFPSEQYRDGEPQLRESDISGMNASYKGVISSAFQFPMGVAFTFLFESNHGDQRPSFSLRVCLQEM